MGDHPIDQDGKPQSESSPSDQKQGDLWLPALVGVLGAIAGTIVGGFLGLLVNWFVMGSGGGYRELAIAMLIISTGGLFGFFCGLFCGFVLGSKIGKNKRKP